MGGRVGGVLKQQKQKEKGTCSHLASFCVLECGALAFTRLRDLLALAPPPPSVFVNASLSEPGKNPKPKETAGLGFSPYPPAPVLLAG